MLVNSWWHCGAIHISKLHHPASVPCHFLQNVLYSRYPRYFSSSRALKPCSGDQEQISPKFLAYVSNVFRRMHGGERTGTIWRSWHRLWCYPGLGCRRRCDVNLLFTGSERKQIKAAWEKRCVRKKQGGIGLTVRLRVRAKPSQCNSLL